VNQPERRRRQARVKAANVAHNCVRDEERQVVEADHGRGDLFGRDLRKERKADRQDVRKSDAIAEFEQHRPEQADLASRRLRERRHEQAQSPGDREEAADDHFADLVRLSAMGSPPLPEGGDGHEHGEAYRSVHSDEPAARIVEKPQVELLVAPDKIGIEDLLVREQRHGEHRDQDDQVDDAHPILAC